MKPTMTVLEENVPKLGDGVTVVSEALKDRAVDLGISYDKIVKIPNGADVEFIKPLNREECREKLGLDKNKRIVMYMGSYNTALYLLINSFKKVIKDISDCILVCVGGIDIKYNRLMEHSDLIKEAFRSENCLFTGKQPYENIPLYLGAADVLALPMENNNVERARWPIRLGDYLASGRAIVASDVGEVGSVLKENKCGVVSQNETDFGDKIREILENEKLRKRLEIASRKIAEKKFGWEKISYEFERAYSEN